jgi:hypothetical protein
MRSTTLRSLAALSILLGVLAVQARAGNNKVTRKIVNGDVLLSWEVDATGLLPDGQQADGVAVQAARDEAERQAAESAREFAQRQAIAFLLDQSPPLIYPDAEKDLAQYVESHLVEKDRKVELQTSKQIPKVNLKLELKMTADDYHELVQKDRQYRASRRQTVFFRMIVAMAALLGGVGLYCRVSQAARGRYPTWFRAAALVLVVMAGIGTWLVS